MRRIFFFLLFSSVAFGQGVAVAPKSVLSVVNGFTRPIANATVTVCPASSPGIPCSPVTVSIFKDTGLTQPLSNPFTADANGNYQFAAANGTYTVTESATGFVGYSYQVTAGTGGIFSNSVLITTISTTTCDAAGGGLCLKLGPQITTNGADNGHNSNLIEFQVKDNSGNPQYNFAFMDSTPGPKQGSIRFVSGTDYPVVTGGGIWTDGPLGTDAAAYSQIPACTSVSEGANMEISDGKAANCGDGTCTTWHTTVTGGTGALKLWIHCNGTNWTLAAF